MSNPFVPKDRNLTCCAIINSKNSKNKGNICKNKAKYFSGNQGYCGIHRSYVYEELDSQQQLIDLFFRMEIKGKRKQIKQLSRSKKKSKIEFINFGFKDAIINQNL